MNGIIITAIICVTLVVLAKIGADGDWKDKIIKEQLTLLGKYKALTDGLLAVLPDGRYEAVLGVREKPPPPEVDGGE